VRFRKRAFDFDFIDGIMKCRLLIIDDFGVSEYARRVCDVVLDSAFK
jgi:DNA replication protein DnaC